jgi:hypothetical protein
MGNIMKKITLLLIIIFTFLFSTTSWGDWSYVSENMNGRKFYYDKDRVRKNGKYLYFWMMIDYIKPTSFGDLSHTKYVQLDCSIFRFKDLKITSYENSKGEGKIIMDFTPKDEWEYPYPDSSLEVLFNKICEEHQ